MVLWSFYPGVCVSSLLSIFPLLTTIPVRSNKGRIPTPSSHPSRRSFDTVSSLIKDMMEEAPQNHASAKKKVNPLFPFLIHFTNEIIQALVRDRFQCPISGVRDAASVKKTRELLDMFLQKKFEARCTECAHIIPESINSGISQGSNKVFLSLSKICSYWRSWCRSNTRLLYGPFSSVLAMKSFLQSLMVPKYIA